MKNEIARGIIIIIIIIIIMESWKLFQGTVSDGAVCTGPVAVAV
jgi:hypothetical protein